MTSPKKLKTDESVKIRYMNWLAQVAGMVMPKTFIGVLGRGSAKTTDFQTERLMAMVHDMPGAPVALISDTYSNLRKNVLPTLIEGLEMKGWREGYHYVIEKQPPAHFKPSYNRLVDYKHTIVFFTGLNLTCISLDRPSIGAGRSYVHAIGDEVKYFEENKIANLLKAVRGYYVRFGSSVFYRGSTFTTDMPDPNKLGEHDWILNFAKKMNNENILLIVQCAFVINRIKTELAVAMQTNDKHGQLIAQKKLDRWKVRYDKVRQDSTLFLIASSFVNVDILTADFFTDQMSDNIGDVKTTILSMLPAVSDGNKFYASLEEKHFYKDGTDTYWAEQFGIGEDEDCRILKHIDKSREIDAGLDFGNMHSMVIGQDQGKIYRCVKFIYVLSPEWLDDLAKKFVAYFKHHPVKVLNLYYDRAGNSKSQAGQDDATKIKNAIEGPANARTGWRVILHSVGQGNIESNLEYRFMNELMGERNPKLPKLLIDYYACKEMRISIQDAKTMIDKHGNPVKDKKSEKLSIERLPLESTNPSDAFKYLMCRREFLKIASAVKTVTSDGVGVYG